MKVLALTRTSSIGPSTRYRIEQYRPLLSERGIQVETRPLFDEQWFALLERPPGPARTLAKALYALGRLAARIGQVRAADRSDADVVLVEQQLFPYLPAWVELLLWPRRKPTLVEFDDAIYLTWGHRRKLERLWRRADRLIVGNRFLEAVAAPFNDDIHVIPTTVDLSRYEQALAIQREHRAGDEAHTRRLRVAWIGLRYNFRYLDELAAPLAALAAEGRDVELVVISSGLPEAGPAWGGVRLVQRPWSEATEAAEIARCDLGVMPLPDSEWARGKCALKLLQYMAAGVPVVASPVGVNADIVCHGENGLLAADGAGWEAAFRQLADDVPARTRIGEAGRATVEAGFSLRGGTELVAKAYGLGPVPADPGDSSRPRR